MDIVVHIHDTEMIFRTPTTVGGSIIGTIVGNIFFMLVCVVVCWYCCYRSKRGQRQASSGRVIVTQPVPTIQPGHQGLPPLQMPQPYPTNQPMYPPSAYQETQFMPVPSAAPPSYVAATQGQYAPYPIK
uniref:uncharacterized protein LOC120329094 isoform X2 n=1 Tax=Styela clava TaxID=7725 RepID=UPI0019397A3E|nr:uncharacterized protein LOC120329094 isoform X2 [Styela clava]